VSVPPMVAIIEDDGAVRVAMESLVRSFGFRTSSYASAEDFLRSQDLNDMSCIVTDVKMAGMSGVELQRYLLGRGDGTPFIFITGYPEERLRRQAIDAGAYGFLTKPFDGNLLKECIDRALQAGAAQSG
jgi:FixJ family two-component response regulator